jgi:hypothetical protein
LYQFCTINRYFDVATDVYELYFLFSLQTNGGILALANGKEIQELDITPLLDMQSSVLENECELDLLGLDR